MKFLNLGLHYLAASVLTIIGGCVALVSCASPNRSETTIATYKGILANTATPQLAPGSSAESEAEARFTAFLENLGTPGYVTANTKLVYAPDAVLNDTLKTVTGADEIQAYFEKTNETMASYEAKIDDVSRSGPDHYFRWTLIYSAKPLHGGEPIHSVGMTQVRFNAQGQVVLHQDFWDSGSAFFEHVPVVGGGITAIRKRL